MDQDVLLEAITKQLDALESNVNAIILLALAAVWSGVRRTRELEAFGMKFDRRHAFWILGWMYLVANVAALTFFLRLGDLLRLVENEKFVEAFTRVAVHPWVLNPLSFFGSDERSTQIHSSCGWGLLVLTWWICNTSLATLMDDKRSRVALALILAFVVVGIGSIVAILSAQQTIFTRLNDVAPQLREQVESARSLRRAGTFIGVAVGLLAFLTANRVQERFLQRKKV
jgi:hypothetical protein